MDCQQIVNQMFDEADKAIKSVEDKSPYMVMGIKRNENDMNIRLECTCSACPEQYWAYTDDIEGGDRIGYIRLRWGHLTCEYLVSGKLDKDSVLVYEHTFEGDGYKGEFDTEEERTHFLEKCKEALIEKHSKKGE